MSKPKFSLNLSSEAGVEPHMDMAMNVPHERAEELFAFAEGAFNKHTAHSLALNECVEHCETLEEVAFIIYQYGHATGHICEKRHPHADSLMMSIQRLMDPSTIENKN